MGEVHRAYDTVKKRTVALKRLPGHLADDAAFQARFRREAEVAARLTEPHVIPIHDFGEIDGRLFIDMRLVAGSDLGSLLARTGPLPPARAAGLVGQVAAALAAAHAEQLVHRDVKPSNVLVAGGPEGTNGEDHAYLVDFGLAHHAEATAMTATGTTIGTAAYMAPERFLGRTVDHRVDVYALGCLLFETLTGRRPYPGEGAAELMYAHLNQPPPAATRLRPDLPAALDEVVARALAKEPGERYGSVAEFAVASRAALGTESTAPAVTAVAPLPPLASQGRRRALLIAGGDYGDSGPRAPAGVDVEALATALRDPAIADFEVTLLVNQPHHVVGAAIGGFYRECRTDDELSLLYVIGHGVYEDGQLYLAMTDTAPDNLLFTALPVGVLDQAIRKGVPHRTVLIVDCAVSHDAPPGDPADPLAALAGDGRSVVFSPEAGGTLTRAVLDGLRDGDADLGGDGDITLDELLAFAQRATEDSEHPPRIRTDGDGTLVIARNVAHALPDHVRRTLDSDRPTDRLEAISQLEALYQAGGPRVREQIVDHLRRLADDDSRRVSAAAADRLAALDPTRPTPASADRAASTPVSAMPTQAPPSPAAETASSPDLSPAPTAQAPPAATRTAASEPGQAATRVAARAGESGPPGVISRSFQLWLVVAALELTKHAMQFVVGGYYLQAHFNGYATFGQTTRVVLIVAAVFLAVRLRSGERWARRFLALVGGLILLALSLSTYIAFASSDYSDDTYWSVLKVVLLVQATTVVAATALMFGSGATDFLRHRPGYGAGPDTTTPGAGRGYLALWVVAATQTASAFLLLLFYHYLPAPTWVVLAAPAALLSATALWIAARCRYERSMTSMLLTLLVVTVAAFALCHIGMCLEVLSGTSYLYLRLPFLATTALQVLSVLAAAAATALCAREPSGAAPRRTSGT
jgi:tRNA A-37 threonylcarbamoyl transferase component Bud32